jgi:hypothetical protein
MGGDRTRKTGVAAAAFSVALALLLALVAGPGHATNVTFDLEIAKSKDGRYKETLNARVPQGPADFFHRVRSKTNVEQKITFKGPGSADSPAYRIRWFKRDDDITQEVTGPGFEFNLPAGGKKHFRVVLKPDPGNDECLISSAQQEGGPTEFGVLALRAGNSTPVC